MRKKTSAPTFANNERDCTLTGPLADTILDTLLHMKISVDHSCGGNATCGTCRIIVCSGIEHLNKRSLEESEFVEGRGWQDNERLACQCFLARGVLVFKIPGNAD